MNFIKISSVLRSEPFTVRIHNLNSRNLTVPAGTPGAGAGKGGGAGGSVRESGGGLGKYGAAQEEGYFHGKTREQLEKLKQKLKDEEEIVPKKAD